MPSFPVIAEWSSDPTRGSLSLGKYREPNKQCQLMKLRLIPVTINAEGERRRQVDSIISLVFGASNLSSSRLVTDTRRSCPPTEITAATQGEIRRIKACAPKDHQHDGVMKFTINARPVLLIPRQPAPMVSEPLQLFKQLSLAKEFSLYAVYPRVV
ncbi:hypothetical protein SLS58_010899 [Diplodia intermedia]|uniref:Uncharacterized protein n=1 Tax=Diplodia intermedia TaxID=856260 RepID=A0ABR3T2Z0_9PEZI